MFGRLNSNRCLCLTRKIVSNSTYTPHHSSIAYFSQQKQKPNATPSNSINNITTSNSSPNTIDRHKRKKQSLLNIEKKKFYKDEKEANEEEGEGRPKTQLFNVGGLFTLAGLFAGVLISFLSPSDENGFHSPFPYFFHTLSDKHTINLSPGAVNNQNQLRSYFARQNKNQTNSSSELTNNINNNINITNIDTEMVENGNKWQYAEKARQLQKQSDMFGCGAFSIVLGLYSGLMGYLWFEQGVTRSLRKKVLKDVQLYELLKRMTLERYKFHIFAGTAFPSVSILLFMGAIIFGSYCSRGDFLKDEYLDFGLIEYTVPLYNKLLDNQMEALRKQTADLAIDYAVNVNAPDLQWLNRERELVGLEGGVGTGKNVLEQENEVNSIETNKNININNNEVELSEDEMKRELEKDIKLQIDRKIAKKEAKNWEIMKLKRKRFIFDWNLLESTYGKDWKELNEFEQQMRMNAGYEVAKNAIMSSAWIVIPVMFATSFGTMYCYRKVWIELQQRAFRRMTAPHARPELLK